MMHGSVSRPDGPHVERLPVLGVMTTFSSDSAAAMAAVRRAYGSWAALAARPELVSPSDAIVRITVRDDAATTPVPARAGATPDRRRPTDLYTLPEPTRLLVDADGVTGEADNVRGESVLTVAERVLAEHERFARDVLDPLTLFLLGPRDREPVHATALLRGDTAILLAAPSGTGKSTLTYAAWRHGFSVLSDEPIYVQLRPRLRVWGRSGRLHLPIGARSRFPELGDIAPTRLSSGKTKLVVETDGSGRRWADRAALCLLRRPAGSAAAALPALEAVTPDRAVAELTDRLDPGFDLFADTIPERIRRIAECGAWRLTLTDEPADALPLLEEVARRMERVP